MGSESKDALRRMTSTTRAVLRAIRADDGVRTTEIAARIGIHRSNVIRHGNRLQRAGLVRSHKPKHFGEKRWHMVTPHDQEQTDGE